jgi:hypothetical protein
LWQTTGGALSGPEEGLLHKLEDENLEVRSYGGVTIGREKFIVAKQSVRGDWESQQASSHLKAEFVQRFTDNGVPRKMRATRYGILTRVLEVVSDGTILLDVRWYKMTAAKEHKSTKNVYLKLHGTLQDEKQPRLVEACSISNQVVFSTFPFVGFHGFARRKAVVFDREFLSGTPLFTVLPPGV